MAIPERRSKAGTMVPAFDRFCATVPEVSGRPARLPRPPSELVAQPELPLPRGEHAILAAVIRDRVAGCVLLAAVEARQVVPIEDVEGLRAHAEPARAAHRHALGEAQVH